MASALNHHRHPAGAVVWPLERPPADFGRALAPPLTSLVGRDDDVDLVANTILAGARLVTLTGPGGVGKTRLALAVASELFAALQHGVCCVPLADLRDPAGVPAAVASALGVHEQADAGTLESVAGWLRDRELMLLFDNFEHLLPAVPHVQDLLRRCPRLVCLVTSRAPLHVSGEHVVPINPLPFPALEVHPPPTAAEIAATPAVELFLQRARAADPRFACSEATATVIAEICRLLDGLPLAIELAAAQAHVLSPAEMLARLDRRLHVLGGGPADQPARLQTMRRTIAWSHDLLSPPAQQLFRTFSIFDGGATLEACEEIAGRPAAEPDGDERPGAADQPWTGVQLRELVDQQLLQRTLDPHGESRFVMLRTVHAFAKEQLEDAGEQDEIARRHARHFVGLAERLEDDAAGAGQVRSLRRLEQELPNFRAANLWLTAAGDSAAALRLARALSPLWLTSGHAREGVDWIEGSLSRLNPAPPEVKAHALAALTSLHFVRGDYDQAVDCCQEILAILGEAGDGEDVATALTNLGCVANHRGQAIDALAFWARALPIQRRRNDFDGIAVLQNNAGILNVARGDLPPARAQLAEAFRIRREHGPVTGLASVTFNLAQLSIAEGDVGAVRPQLERSLALSLQAGDVRGVAWAHLGLGLHLSDHGEASGATDALLDSLMLGDQVGDVYTVFSCLDGLATLSINPGHAAMAAKLHGYASWLRASVGATVHDQDAAANRDELMRIRSETTPAEFTSAWASGELMRVSDVVAEVGRHRQASPCDEEPTTGPRAGPDARQIVLSVRELEVLSWVVNGRSDREISEGLYISRRTASHHVSAILRKLDVPNRAAAVTHAHRHRLV